MPFLTTWEWLPQYRLRSLLYPMYLSLPLHVARALGIDTNLVVRLSPILMNSLLQVLGDHYLVKMTSENYNNELSKVALTYSLCNKIINLVFQKTMTNGAEAVFCLIALYNYGRLKYDKSGSGIILSKELAIMTAAITIAFIIRSSSLISWVPLIAITIVRWPVSVVKIIIAGFTVAVPIVLASALLDSWYYGAWTVPWWNFLEVNVV